MEQVRRDARASIIKGAFTADYVLDLKWTYELMYQALAAEILCVPRYSHHHIIAKGIDFPEVATEFAEHAGDAHRHMMAIADRIDQLGGDPDFNPSTVTQRSATEYGSSDVLARMVEEDLVAECDAIEIYRRLVGWFGNADPTSRHMFEGILKDGEDHANDLSDLLAAVDPAKSRRRACLPGVPSTRSMCDRTGQPSPWPVSPSASAIALLGSTTARKESDRWARAS